MISGDGVEGGTGKLMYDLSFRPFTRGIYWLLLLYVAANGLFCRRKRGKRMEIMIGCLLQQDCMDQTSTKLVFGIKILKKGMFMFQNKRGQILKFDKF